MHIVHIRILGAREAIAKTPTTNRPAKAAQVLLEQAGISEQKIMAMVFSKPSRRVRQDAPVLFIHNLN